MKLLLYVSLLFALQLQSCDCIQCATGTVTDQVSGKPIEGVSVCKTDLENKFNCILTDSLGRFEIVDISGGLFRCPKMYIRIEKAGYKTIETKKQGLINLEKE